jgi:NTE family protein
LAQAANRRYTDWIVPVDASRDIGLVLAGGGARGAYQAGVLRALADCYPDLGIRILAGVSAGAINTAFLANHEGRFVDATEGLCELWSNLHTEDVVRVQPTRLLSNVVKWGVRLGSGGALQREHTHTGMVDSAPLREMLARVLGVAAGDNRLPGFERRLANGSLKALAITTTSYATGHAVTWVGGSAMERVHGVRQQRPCQLTLDHVLASSSLPLFFPAVRLPDGWHGDGGIRETAPLSPAIHLGADRILAISPRRNRSDVSPELELVDQYPPPAQILGILMNSIFLDMLDEDAKRLDRINQILLNGTPHDRQGFRPIRLLVVRPSADLGKMARDYEHELPSAFRYLTRGWGTRQANGSDALAMLMFEAAYTRKLVELGEADGHARAAEFRQFLEEP